MIFKDVFTIVKNFFKDVLTLLPKNSGSLILFILYCFSSFYWQNFITESEWKLNPQLKVGMMQFSKYSLASNIFKYFLNIFWHQILWSTFVTERVILQIDQINISRSESESGGNPLHISFRETIGFFETWMRLRLTAWRWRWYFISWDFFDFI